MPSLAFSVRDITTAITADGAERPSPSARYPVSTNTITQLESSVAVSKASLQFPFLDLQAQFAGLRDEIMAEVERVLESQRFILGPDVETLEFEIARYVGADYAVGCASGSDALLLALMALGVGEGDEVITVPFTFGAPAGSIA